MRLLPFVALAFGLLATPIVSQGCSGCGNSKTVKAVWVPGFTHADDNVPNTGNEEWLSDPNNPGTWYFTPEDIAREYSLGIEGEKKKVGAKADITWKYGNYTLIKLTNLNIAYQSGVCVGKYPDCFAKAGCSTTITFTIEMIKEAMGSDRMNFLGDTLVGVTSNPAVNQGPVSVTKTESSGCNGDNQETTVHYWISGWWFDYDFISVEWRCKKCPGGGL